MPNKNNNQEIRVRIAPSPTGALHLGTARTALFNYLFARKNNGKFILRIENTDLERSSTEYEKDILNGLKWLGLDWDEGPYYQTQRTEIYRKYIKQLLGSGLAFWCYHTQEDLDKEKQEQMERKEAPRHICSYRNQRGQRGLSQGDCSLKGDSPFGTVPESGVPEKALKRKGIIRFYCPDKKVVFDDLIRGRLEFDAGLLGDISIAKDEETPLYNLAVVVDDYEMKISHVIRGEDHISNTPKQILIGQALGLPQPHFAHLPLILGPDRSKLSKRHGVVSISWYQEQGYLPEAMLNFMALLGWNPGTEKEIFSLKGLIKEFSLERVQKGGAVFNSQRLDWLNGYYIRQMDLSKLTEVCLPYLVKAGLIEPLWSQGEQSRMYAVAPDAFGIKKFKISETGQEVGFDYLQKAVALEKDRLKKLSEIGELTNFIFKDKLDYPVELLIWKKMTLKQVNDNLDILEEKLSKTAKFDQKLLEGLLLPLTKKYGSGEILWPLRAALSGKKASPGPFEIMEVLGKEKTIERIREARELIEKSV